MFDKDGYWGISTNINEYKIGVWTDQKRSVSSVIIVHVAPTFNETTLDQEQGEVVLFTVMNVITHLLIAM
jgi:hypothetical protein